MPIAFKLGSSVSMIGVKITRFLLDLKEHVNPFFVEEAHCSIQEFFFIFFMNIVSQ